MDTLARETAAAFRVWERAADTSFHEVGDARDADIVLGTRETLINSRASPYHPAPGC